MITVGLLIVAIIAMIAGHIFKVKRWGLLVSVYETPSFGTLLNSLSIGHFVNTLVPFRLGDVIRIVNSGKKMKNGIPFSIATVISDLYIDFLTIGGMFFVLSLIGKGGQDLLQFARGYANLFYLVACLTVVCILARKTIKKLIAWGTQIFNETIQFNLLYTTYLAIVSFKDIVYKIDKLKFSMYTIAIWSSYVLSYVLFAEALQASGAQFIASEVFLILFNQFNLLSIKGPSFSLWGMYMILPLIVCFLLSKVVKSESSTKETFALPQASDADKMSFLKIYYEENNRDYVRNYLEINKDVTVISDNSAGSNASTVVIMRDGKMYFRKYAFGQDGKKLAEQVEWIKKNQKRIPLPSVCHDVEEENYCVYDMPFYANSIGLFQYIHTMPIEKSWEIIQKALDDLKTGLYTQHVVKADEKSMNKYIDSKIEKNVMRIQNESRLISNLEKYDTINVNGIELKTLKNYQDMLNKHHLKKVFENDIYSEIHGDLTVENIVCLLDDKEIDVEEAEMKIIPQDYYFIDPNTGNIHDSMFLDYAKLLQSLHGNYEFLMKVTSVNVEKNSISYLLTKSEAYSVLYKKVKEYLYKNFSREDVLSIYYHEIVHWLRLMPYKISKNEKLSVVFYSGLLQILADVREIENEK